MRERSIDESSARQLWLWGECCLWLAMGFEMLGLISYAGVVRRVCWVSGVLNRYRALSNCKFIYNCSLRGGGGDKFEMAMVKARTLPKFGLLLALVSSIAFSVSMSSSLARLGFCSGGIIVVPDDFQRISWAVGNASVGSTIRVRAGSYFESVIIVDKAVTLIGESAENTIIDGNGTLQCIFQVIAGNVTIGNLTLQDTSNTTYLTPAVRLSNVTGVTLTNASFWNVGCGVEIRFSNFTRILDSKISNAVYGVLIRDNSNENVVAGNTLKNDETAVSISSFACSHNRIFHNNFFDNTNQFLDFGSFTSFDNGYPSGGNFWGDYAGPDLFSGPYQNETGSDGILDVGYPSGNPLDRYPFSSPLTEIEVAAAGNSFFLQISTNVTLTDCFLNETAKSIGLMVQPQTLGNGSCRITIPRELLSTNDTSEWRVSETYLNGTALEGPYRAITDSENTYIYFTYTRSNISRIEIRGTMVLSEVSISLLVVEVILASVVLLFGTRIANRGKNNFLARAPC